MANIAFRSEFAWGPANVEALEQACLAGLSASQIAAQLGATRNMVIGKARRMGFALRGNDDSRLAAHRIKARRERPVRPPPAPRLAKPPPPPRAAKPVKIRRDLPEITGTVQLGVGVLRTVASAGRFVCLADLGPNQCRYPVDDPPEGEGWRMTFCAADCGESVYCAPHMALSYRPAPAGEPEPSRWNVAFGRKRAA